MCGQFLLNDKWFSHMERQSVAVLCCYEFLNSLTVKKILESSDSTVRAALWISSIVDVICHPSMSESYSWASAAQCSPSHSRQFDPVVAFSFPSGLIIWVPHTSVFFLVKETVRRTFVVVLILESCVELFWHEGLFKTSLLTKVVAKYSPSISFISSSWFWILVTSLDRILAAPFLNEDPCGLAAATLLC